MFDRLKPLAPDPILSLAAAARADARRDKLDLTIGVYFDDAGITPVMRAVKGAEQTRIDTEISKSYLTPRGDPAFCTLMQDMTLGDTVTPDRLATVQTPGGSGAIAITAPDPGPEP